MSEPGPVGGKITTVVKTEAVTVQTAEPHGLIDGERVRLNHVDDNVLGYVKVVDDSHFSLYLDPGLKKNADVKGIIEGRTITRLAVEDWALAIGINYYFYEALKDLVGPAKDAELFARWAVKSAYLPDDQVILIQSSYSTPKSLDEAVPKYDTITQAFADLAALADQKQFRRLGRRLYIFLSGHGIVPTLSDLPDYREAALLAANASAVSLSRHIGGRAYAEWFRSRGIFDEVILFLDCCRDEKRNESLTAPALTKGWPRQTTNEGRHFYAAPTKFGSSAWEKGFGSPPVVRGVFAYALIEALNNPAICDEMGYLTGSVLEQHLYSEIPALMDKQEPVIDYPHNAAKREIIFVKRLKPEKPKAIIEFDPKFSGKTASLYHRNGNNQVGDAHIIDEKGWKIDVVLNDLYKVVVDGTELIFEAKGVLTSVKFN